MALLGPYILVDDVFQQWIPYDTCLVFPELMRMWYTLHKPAVQAEHPVPDWQRKVDTYGETVLLG